MRLAKKVLIGAMISITSIVTVLVYARYIEPNQIVINKTSMQPPIEIKAKQFRIVFFSDTHFGKDYNPIKIEGIVQKINEQKADFVLFGGDFFDSYYRDQANLNLDYLSDKLGKIQAKYEKIAVWGNHDYGGGSIRIYEDFMEKSGFTLLKNQELTTDEIGVTVSGLDDYLLGKPVLPAENVRNEGFHIVVTHAPDIANSFDYTNVDLVLAGHSHGGQVSVPFITDKIMPPGAKKYRRGWYQLSAEKGTRLFVSKGLGTTVLPLRFMNVPEIVVIDIEP